MFEMKVSVAVDMPDLPGIANAIHDLADAIRGGSGKVTPEIPEAQAEPEAVPAPAVPEEQPAPVPVPVAPEPAPEPVPVAQPAPAPAKKYTFEQISKAGAALCADLSNMEKLIALLNGKYGVQAITMIDESRYSDLAADLIALGATIEEA